MTQQNTPSRRSFLKGSAWVAAPLIAAPAAALADDGTAARLALLEHEAAVRTLHGGLLRRINAGDHHGAAALFAGRPPALPAGLVAVTPDGDAPAVEIAVDGARATCRQACLVELASSLEPDCTFARMAEAQGSGCVRRAERQVLSVDYVRGKEGWAVAGLSFAAA